MRLSLAKSLSGAFVLSVALAATWIYATPQRMDDGSISTLRGGMYWTVVTTYTYNCPTECGLNKTYTGVGYYFDGINQNEEAVFVKDCSPPDTEGCTRSVTYVEEPC